MIRYSKLGLWIVINFIISGCYAQEILECPDSIEIESRVINIIPGYKAIPSKRSSPLSGITFFLGSPNLQMSIAPDEETDENADKESTAIWVFTKPDNTEVWYSCDYSGHGSLLARQMSKIPSSCILRYKKLNDGVRVLVDANCVSVQPTTPSPD